MFSPLLSKCIEVGFLDHVVRLPYYFAAVDYFSKISSHGWIPWFWRNCSCFLLPYDTAIYGRTRGFLLGILFFPGVAVVKNPPDNAGYVSSIPGSGRSPGEGNGQSTPIFLPGKSHRQRSLAGYSPWDRERVRHNLVTKTINNKFILPESTVIICRQYFRKWLYYLYPDVSLTWSSNASVTNRCGI